MGILFEALFFITLIAVVMYLVGYVCYKSGYKKGKTEECELWTKRYQKIKGEKLG